MLKSSEHYSIAELIESSEKELEDLKKQNKPSIKYKLEKLFYVDIIAFERI